MSTAPAIDAERALDLLTEVVTEHGPEHVYQHPEGESRCHYAWDGRPSCLVGQALYRAGIPVETLRALDAAHVTHIREVQSPALSGLTEGARRVFGAAQTYQDRGNPWGDSLAVARTHLYG